MPSVSVVQVSGECQLRCLSCKLWGHPFEPNSTMPARLLKGPFLFPPKVHFMGGEPLDTENLKQRLQLYKSKGCKTAIWTHGVVDAGAYAQALPWIDQVYVYMPAADEETYRLITGEDAFDQVLTTIEALKAAKKTVVLNTSVRLDTLSVLPDIHDLARDLGIPLLIHYAKSEGFSKESIAYINRYRSIKKVSVFVTERYSSKCCEGFPLKAIEQPWQLGLNWIYHIKNALTPS